MLIFPNHEQRGRESRCSDGKATSARPGQRALKGWFQLGDAKKKGKSPVPQPRTINPGAEPPGQDDGGCGGWDHSPAGLTPR